nr:glycosyltransferase [Flammeovirgaceae bacterium]
GYKGLDILIEAFGELSNEYQLIIAGECYEDFKKYELLINKNRNKDRIKLFNKYIPDSEVKYFFSASDVCVNPYKSGTQSGVIATAFHFDIPTIVTDVGNLKESVETYKTGLSIPEPKASVLKLAIEEYFNSSLKKMYKKNIEEFKEKYTWENLSRKLTEFSQKL